MKRVEIYIDGILIYGIFCHSIVHCISTDEKTGRKHIQVITQ